MSCKSRRLCASPMNVGWTVRTVLSVPLIAASLMAAGSVGPARAQTVQVVDIKTIAEGWRASDLDGKDVKNDRNDTVGEIDDVMITKEYKPFAILQVGGFLGIGGYLVAVPFDHLQISDDGDTIVMAGATKENLQQMPEFRYRNGGEGQGQGQTGGQNQGQPQGQTNQ